LSNFNLKISIGELELTVFLVISIHLILVAAFNCAHFFLVLSFYVYDELIILLDQLQVLLLHLAQLRRLLGCLLSQLLLLLFKEVYLLLIYLILGYDTTVDLLLVIELFLLLLERVQHPLL